MNAISFIFPSGSTESEYARLQNLYGKILCIASLRNVGAVSLSCLRTPMYWYLCGVKVCGNGCPGEGTKWILSGNPGKTVIQNIYGNKVSTLYTIGNNQVFAGNMLPNGANMYFQVIILDEEYVYENKMYRYRVLLRQGNKYVSDQDTGLTLLSVIPGEKEQFILRGC